MAYPQIVMVKEKIQQVIDSTEWEKFDTPLLMEKGIELRSSLIIATRKCDKILDIILKYGESK